MPPRRPTAGPARPTLDFSGTSAHSPLAARMRPHTLEDFVGQEHLVGERGALRRMIQRGHLASMVLWGPPGTGKTTLARLLADAIDAPFATLSAVMSGVADVRGVIAGAREWIDQGGRSTVLFLDEIHRFNKAQQDALLPQVEDGTITLIGATTENPYFEVNSALLSRLRVFRLEPLSDEQVGTIVDRALASEHGFSGAARLPDDAREHLVSISAGDARAALNVLEAAAAMAGVDDPDAEKPVAPTLEEVEIAAQERILTYDRAGDGHYGTVSAFIKSLRGNDPDAALYWLATMIAAGEDPKFVARRIIIAASEDVGNADPRALQVAVAAAHALEFIGLPEAQYALAQAAVHIALSPKSDATGRAYGAAMADVLKHGSLPVPNHLLSAGHPLLKRHGIGVGYLFPHDFEGDDVDQQYLPDALVGRRYYVPSNQGYEVNLAARMAARDDARQTANEQGRPRRKNRPSPPTASMGDAMRPREENKKRIAARQKREAG
jgi:putative ATPase